MPHTPSTNRNRAFIFTGLGASLVVALLLSPFASEHPDGLDRVAEDLEFTNAEVENPPAQELPTAQLFDEYALKGVPAPLATPLAGLVGTLAAFGLAWGIGKLTVRKTRSDATSD
jgi:cobalt/nickel transport protein